MSSHRGMAERVPYPLNSLHFVQGHLERSYGSGGFPQGPRLVSRLSVLWSSRAEGGWQDATMLGNAVLRTVGLGACMQLTWLMEKPRTGSGFEKLATEFAEIPLATMPGYFIMII